MTSAKFSMVINGELHGHFHGKMGFRQGILFPLPSLAGYASFFFPSCSGFKLSHLMFADDMFILRGTTPQSFCFVD